MPTILAPIQSEIDSQGMHAGAHDMPLFGVGDCKDGTNKAGGLKKAGTAVYMLYSEGVTAARLALEDTARVRKTRTANKATFQP